MTIADELFEHIIIKEMEPHQNKEYAKHHQKFFKTGKGEYGEGDIFIGLTVPEIRKIVKNHTDLPFSDIQKLLNSKIHEHRFAGLVILVNKYQKAKKDEALKEKIYKFYLKNTQNINNWDLVDVSCHKIVGEYLLESISTYSNDHNDNINILYKLAKSDNLWEKRISIISTFAFIRKNNFHHALKISEILLNDKHDLIHKAVGWMLREIGKRNKKILEEFLEKYAQTMPRTMLRYAIEKFDKESRAYYLKKIK